MAEQTPELPDAETLAYTFSEAVADEHGDAAQEYLQRFVDELLTLEPGLRERFSDQLIGGLKEELIRREDARHVHAAITLIEEIEQDWRSEQ